MRNLTLIFIGLVWLFIPKALFSQETNEKEDLLTLMNTWEDKGNYEKALEYCLELVEVMKREQDPQYASYLTQAGNLYVYLYRNEKAREYFLMALPILYKSGNQLEYAKCLLNIGKTSDWLGDRPGALESLQKALNILKKVGDKALLANGYYRLAIVYNNLYRYDLALENLEQAYQLLKNTTNYYYTAECLGVMGIIHRELGQFEQSISYFKKSMETKKKISEKDSPILINDYFDIAQSYELAGQMTEATNYYQKALDLSNIHPDHVTRASVLYKVGNFFTRTLKVDQALALFQEMISQQIPSYTTTNPFQHPDFEAAPYTPIPYIVALDEKAKALKVKEGDRLKNLKAVDTCYQIVLNQIEQVRRGFRSEEAKLEIQQQAREFYTRALENCLLLYQLSDQETYLSRAFSIAEKSKTAALYESIQTAKMIEGADLPIEILDQETNLRVNIQRLEEVIFELENQQGETNSVLLDKSWTEKYFLEQKYDSIIKVLENKSIASPDQNRANAILSPFSIQKKLTENQAFVTYYLTDSVLHGFVIIKDDFAYYSRELDAEFIESVKTYREILLNTGIDIQRYQESSYRLYQLLIEPIEGLIREKDLIIAPDGILATIPFESLVIQEGNPGESFSGVMEYLMVQKHNIHYTYSSIFFLKDHKSHSTSLKTLALAPSFNQTIAPIDQENNQDPDPRLTRGKLAELKGTIREVELISNILNTRVFTGEMATEGVFKESADQYGILHLATHAIIDEEKPINSYLVFTSPATEPGEDNLNDEPEDNNLYAWELYNMRLNAQLAVLSACNTGFGKLRRGEGVMSLGRAFAYAGVPSIVMSLWPAEDESTADLMGHFYEGLAEGQSKDEALRKAKIRYLAESPPRKHHPFYWAGFVVQGDSGPLEQGRSFVWIWLLAGLIFLVFGIYSFKKGNSG